MLCLFDLVLVDFVVQEAVEEACLRVLEVGQFASVAVDVTLEELVSLFEVVQANDELFAIDCECVRPIWFRWEFDIDFEDF